MIDKPLYHKILFAICFVLWFFLFTSINIYPKDLLNLKSPSDVIDAARIILPLLTGTSILIFLIAKIINAKKKIIVSNYLLIFLLISFFQLIGAIFADRLNFETLYVIFFTLILISLFLFIEYFKMQNLYYIFLYSLIFFILISVVSIFFLKFEDFIESSKTLNLYTLSHPDSLIMGHPAPRATGYSRMLAVLLIFIVVLIDYKKNLFKSFLFFIILILGTLVWLFQSRGTYLSYTLSILFLIFILNYKNNLLKKITRSFVFILFPIILSYFLINIINFQKSDKYIYKTEENTEKQKKLSEFHSKYRIVNDNTSSGRLELWSIALGEFNNNKIFGYGPQADRVILNQHYKKIKQNNPYGNNVSNALIYTFLSGGFISALLFSILYALNIFYILKYIKYYKTNLHLPSQLSLIYIVFFSIRSIFENSYAIWGIDQMFLLISIAIINYQFLHKKFK